MSLPNGTDSRKSLNAKGIGDPCKNGYGPGIAPTRPMPMVLPEVTAPNSAAADIYALHGFHITPVRPGTKAPYLDRWPERATCDLDVVREHWRNHPDDGIAIHVGGCWLLVIDVDKPEIVAEWLWPLLERAVFRSTTTDPNSRRGHYFYRLRPGEMFGCGLCGLKPPNGEAAGFEVKCNGGAIVVGPTHHPRADEGGCYATGPAALIPLRPDEIAAKLNPAFSNGERRALTAAEAQAFLDTYSADAEPYALEPICRDFDPTPSNRHKSLWDALCWGMREAKAGRFPAKRAVDELHKRWTDSIGGEYRDGDTDEFDRMLRDAIARADADGTVEELRARAHRFTSLETYRNACDGINSWAPKLIDAPATNSRFRLVSARELAEQVTPMRWLVRGIWPERSAGVLGGDKKSLKTWNLQAIALAVAAGTALFDEYPATSQGGVLYLCGEGGRDTFANRHQVIAARYGIDADTLRELTFGVEFGVGMLTDDDFTDAVKRYLDELQPKLVILDPLYAYHPRDVEVQNVYARGPMLTNLRALVGGDAALIVGDHFNKTASRRLDLDNIAQAGMAQWADSWILQKHRDTPNLDDDKFWLEVETGTRRGGGRHIEVDWSMERDCSDPDLVLWTKIDWDTRPFVGDTSIESQHHRTAERILQVVKDHPFELTESQVVQMAGGRRDKTFEVFNGLKVNGFVVVKNCPREESGRMVKRDLVGVAETAKRFRRSNSRPGTSSPTGNGPGEVVPDEGTSSEPDADD